MTSEQERGRIYRFRLWLGYMILPETTEFSVAMARQQAGLDLKIVAERSPDNWMRMWAARSYSRLREKIPVRESYDNLEPLEGDRNDE